MLLYQVAIVVVYGISISAILLLLATTRLYGVRWHPVVNVILWILIPGTVLSLLHYPLHNTLREHLPIIPGDRPVDQQHTSLAYFCAAEAILLYMFSAISSGLTVSFTLSLFAVVIKSSRPQLHSSPRTWSSFRWLWDPTTTTLCVAPFLWSLPLLASSIETLVRTSRNHYPSIYYSNTYCNIDDVAYQTVSGVALGLPVIFAIGLVVATLIMVVRISIRDREQASQMINISLAFRFAAVVLQIFITAIITICEISLKDDQLRGVFRFHLYWTALTPLTFFGIFGTQRDLMSIWRYWCYRLVGKELSFTPRSSGECQTLSNGSGPSALPTNERHVIRTMGDSDRDGYVGDRKTHKTSSSAGGRESGSISEPPGLTAGKAPAVPIGSSIRSHRDVESIMMPSSMRLAAKRDRGTLPAIPSLAYTAESLDNISPTSTSLQQAQFYATSAAMSSQGLSSNSHSHGLLASQNDLPRPNPPLVTVTDGFGAMFGAQVPQSSRTVGRPIILPQERERRLAVPTNRQRRPSAQSDFSRDSRKSVGLPPPPRSPRPSTARPSSAGTGILDFGGSQRGPTPAGLDVPTSAPVATTWNWDSPFNATSASAPSTSRSNGTSGSHGEQEGIELQEKLSNRSTEYGSAGQSSSRESGISKNSRVSVASDRTFG
ncbi:hypothetical protein BDV93DRAFT_520603 [Ceratobasidium sp. AG-I]|nr:hypothetical protein BDV93DRAFT_520603 [Ceratobasidium sp. AG-I]